MQAVVGAPGLEPGMKLEFKASTSTIPPRPRWWVPEELNLPAGRPSFLEPADLQSAERKGTQLVPEAGLEPADLRF
jgi:hypothetical protein